MITRTINHLLGAFDLRLCPISKPEWGFFLNTIAMVVLIEPVAVSLHREALLKR